MKKSYKLQGDVCANCAAKIQDKVSRMEGVNGASVNAMTLKFTLDADDARYDELLAEAVRTFAKIEPDCTVLA